jgi:hypothetical protein
LICQCLLLDWRSSTRLAKDKGENIRYLVATNNQTSEITLKHLAQDKFDEIRRAVAENKSTPKDVLIQLVYDKSEEVRLAAVRNLYSHKSNE